LARGAVSRVRHLRSNTPASAGACPIEVDHGKGFIRANGRNRLQAAPRVPRDACCIGFSRRRLIRIPVRAGCPARDAAPPQTPACQVPAASDTRRVGEGGVRPPKGANKTKPPGLASSIAGRQPAHARKARDPSHSWGAGDCANATFSTTTGQSARAPHSGFTPEMERASNRRRTFSRAGYQCVLIGLYPKYGCNFVQGCSRQMRIWLRPKPHTCVIPAAEPESSGPASPGPNDSLPPNDLDGLDAGSSPA